MLVMNQFYHFYEPLPEVYLSRWYVFHSQSECKWVWCFLLMAAVSVIIESYIKSFSKNKLFSSYSSKSALDIWYSFTAWSIKTGSITGQSAVILANYFKPWLCASFSNLYNTSSSLPLKQHTFSCGAISYKGSSWGIVDVQIMILSLIVACFIRSGICSIKGFPAISSNIFFGNRVDFNRAVMRKAVFI